MDIDKEAWICLLRSSQKNFQPKRLKNTTTSNVICASFKLSPMDHEEIFGASKLPIISNQDTKLINRIISYAHTEQVLGLGKIHNTVTGTSSIIKRRPFQVIFANLKANVSKYITTVRVA